MRNKVMVHVFDPDQAIKEWSRIPIDDLGYFTAEELLLLRNEQLKGVINIAGKHRWDVNEWRNRGNALADFMNPQAFKGRMVMDFGCGLGIDAVKFVLNGSRITLADMNPATVMMAEQVLILCTGFIADRLVITSPLPPFWIGGGIDLFWSMGVLHHSPFCREILKRACDALNVGGEIRVCLYSDRRWRKMMDCDPPEDTPNHPGFAEYVRKCDSVGLYCDWYDA